MSNETKTIIDWSAAAIKEDWLACWTQIDQMSANITKAVELLKDGWFYAGPTYMPTVTWEPQNNGVYFGETLLAADLANVTVTQQLVGDSRCADLAGWSVKPFRHGVQLRDPSGAVQYVRNVREMAAIIETQKAAV